MAIYQNTKIAGSKSLYISGQTPSKDGFTPETISEQMDIVLEKIHAALEENGLTVEELVKITIYLTHVDHLSGAREKLAAFVGSSKPTATLVIVAGLIDPAFKVEIDGIAAF
ncbi:MULTISPECIES: RidA family protein [unclassified Enterococcus]|uniref:RidA family protein n=1 Tax=unclassified Enterococcus TaxID=2608891 RepID=UPI001CE08C58|nr:MULTISPECIES: RidA family protein [unclassified Enterococcus]MCA5013749.1 RidA family protein [Enterococcus sp. S23]MCA5016999.1 RidA family protein [Enterococcus sp. S22(2020)]